MNVSLARLILVCRRVSLEMKFFATSAFLFVLTTGAALADRGSAAYKSGGQIGKVLLFGMIALVVINHFKKKES